jgi:hypothetical protein
MFNEKLEKIVIAAFGAAVFSTAVVSAAVGPARAVETTPVYALAQAGQDASPALA